MVPQRFWDKVIPEPNSGCWIWTGATTHGYGYFTAFTGSVVRTHKYLYEELVGKVPEGLELDHKCRVRCCCNPDHLEPVTRSENTKRGIDANNGLRAYHDKRSAAHACVNGHPFTGKNEGYRKDGRRRCLECARVYARSRRLGR